MTKLNYLPLTPQFTIGLPCESKPNEFLMISEWESLESLKKFAGEDWNTAVIDPRESHLLVEAAVDHYYLVDN